MSSLVPPFTLETATQKVRLAEDGWNSRDHSAGGRTTIPV
ncbi:nuclear transport factor 2 (NTF2) superfamily protein [Rhizobium leguminosarum]|uniref:Nuclear transport factor 2 (NTF2) superfamily protein n=1 Tax=Rhizobium esperanzae TaxID=1967781 RepID=A0A7W6XX56_9HYPH|nr:nuclear transport factor 2 (NTF2) superfamily protein [Rhizobium esperanzae]MDH6204850.1 nuclear transport factor 2 (NTF2) superfamily protein [Rhizobium leguminosarum]